MFVLLFVMFVSCQGFLLDGNTQTTIGRMSLDDKRYNTIMGLLSEEKRARSKLEAIVAQELLALRQEVAKCGNGNGGHNQIHNQGSLTNETKALKEEIIYLKRDQELFKTAVAGLMEDNTELKNKVMQLEHNLTTLHNTDCNLNFRNETTHFEKRLQVANNKLNAVINDANSRKQDFISLFQKVTGLTQNHTLLKDNVLLLEQNFSMENAKRRNEASHLERALQMTNNKLNATANEENSRNQSFVALSEKVVGLMQNNTVLKDIAMQLERNFTKYFLNFRNETSHLERALQLTNDNVNAITINANARKQDFIALFQKVQSTEQRLENSTRSLEGSQNMTFLKLQKEIMDGDLMLKNKTETMEVKLNNKYKEIRQEYTNMFSQAKLVEQNLSDKTKLLEMRENSTSLKLQQQTVMLQQELNKMSNRVALTTCANGDAKNGVIQFTKVKISNGIHNTDLIRTTGIFTCENPGLYLISVYIQTDSKGGVYYVWKNFNPIADAYSSQDNSHKTISVTLIEKLTVNDTISVTSGLFVFGNIGSCLTILQIQ